MPCLRCVLCMSAVPATPPPFFFWVSAACFEEEVVLMSEPGGVSKRTPAVKEEAISQDRGWKLLSIDSCLWGRGGKSKTEARPVIRTKNCALPYGRSPGPQTCCHFIPSNPGVQASSSEQTEAARGYTMGPDPHGLPGRGRANRLDSSSLPELPVMHLSTVLFREGDGQGLGWSFSQPWPPCLWGSRKGPEG